MITYLWIKKIVIVATFETIEIDTPIYPMSCKDILILVFEIIGFALRRIAKWVKWLHSQVVVVNDEYALVHPLVDHSPRLSIDALHEIIEKVLEDELYSNFQAYKLPASLVKA